ncbi:MAG: hypothetical protein H0W84_12270, partial [Bacteroidetes bacterium]|nr:hypothetical protein [Bacteroidota bacterium]
AFLTGFLARPDDTVGRGAAFLTGLDAFLGVTFFTVFAAFLARPDDTVGRGAAFFTVFLATAFFAGVAAFLAGLPFCTFLAMLIGVFEFSNCD